MTFVQIIDCKTDRADELDKIMDTWVETTQGRRTATHSMVGRDRAADDHFVEIVEFPSYEDAMRNSRMPETNRVFEEMVALCVEPPTFTNLDVVRDEQLNKATARRFFEAASAGDLDALPEILTDDCRDHDPTSEEDLVGVRAVSDRVAMYRAAFDFRATVEDQTAEGNRVSTRWTWRATHRGEFMGTAPTGKEVMMTGQTVHSFRDGRIAEAWWNFDTLGLLRQLGAVDL
ncbi:ester cyclase [Wenjunlia tyrosinilytica]|uniref:Ester cyclase n=1 Tax=Wenjunlia tyrosinilytica TaxID=1544741 RepID=A0A918DZC9_9ACTN|nr:ester cyclase [Wenjunlia tyrosinilytica]GGO89627.1 hypothetical protein GCM10012280_33310 [Wenjunlia tyrosinilytica]